MSYRKIHRLHLLITGLFILLLWGCAKVDNVRARDMVSLFAENNNVVGLQAAVGVSGEIVWSMGVGYADLEQQVPVDPGRTLMRIGSVSKSLTAAAMGQLVEMDLLDLDAPVQTYVPEFPNKRYPITSRQVGGHLAGIRHYRNQEFLNRERYDTVLDGLSFFKDDSLLFEPGSEFRYSSYGWNLLSAVVEGASGEEFLPLMQRLVFDPLDMDHMAADWTNHIIEGRGRYYIADSIGHIFNAPYVDNSYKWAGGGFLSTSEDLVRFGMAHLQPGMLEAETLALLTTSQITTSGDTTNYGIGWASGVDDEGRRWFGHPGGSIGGTTVLRIYPEAGVVVAIIANMSDVRYGDLPDRLAALFF